MKSYPFSLTLLLLLVLLPGCSLRLGAAPAAPTPGPSPTPIPDIGDYLDQAARDAPFTLLVPDRTKLPAAIELTGLKIPAEGDEPFVVVQVYDAPGGEIRITQSSLVTGQPPMKAVGEVTVRGKTGFWLELNVGERALYWEEDDSSLTIVSDLKDENTLKWAEALAAYETAPVDSQEDEPENPDAP